MRMKKSNKLIVYLIILNLFCAGLISCSGNQSVPDKPAVGESYEAGDFKLILIEAGILGVSSPEPKEEPLIIGPEQETTEEEPLTEYNNPVLPPDEELVHKYFIAPNNNPAVLTTEALLYDFDYLTRVLEENYPFYGAAHRKFGIDLHRQKAAARAAVENISATGNDSRILRDFADILASYIINPMRNMGHMMGYRVGSQSHKVQLALIKRDGGYEIPSYPNLYGGYLHDMFTSPAAVRYYGDPFDGVDIESFIESALFTPDPDNIVCDIIQPDSVAYIQIRGMNSANFTSDRQIISAFIETIGDFDHLIIDLRGNRGGYAGNFLQNIMAPLIDEPASLLYYIFFKGGEHNLMFDDFYYRDLQWQSAHGLRGFLDADTPLLSVNDIFPSLIHANADDFADLSYGFKRELTVTPSANRRAFDGKIWILIDGRSISAAEISAALAKESGFATLVGTPTGGMFGGYTAAFIGLPNTGAIIRYDYGYVTDLHGRSIEELGVAPDIYNRSGMDALETVLALISEGNY